MIGFLHRTQTLRLRDDRGNMFPIRSPHLKLERKADPAAITWYRLAQLRRDSESLPTRIAGYGTIAFAATALVWFGTAAAIGGETGRAVVLLAFVPVFVAIGLMWRQQLRSTLARYEAKRFELPPACPSCRYNLASLPPEPDGCTICPECGAAWRLASTEPEQKEKIPH